MSAAQASGREAQPGSDQPRPVKRARTRGSNACTACRARRSKCDLVDGAGCHRCKQLGTDCSLKVSAGGEVLDSQLSTGVLANVSFPPHTSPSGLSDLHRRIQQLESELSSLRKPHPASPHFDYTIHGATSSSPSSTLTPTGGHLALKPLSNNVTSRPKRAAEADRDEAWYRRWADPETFGLIHRGIHGKAEEGLRDPVLEGVITETQAEAAYQLFKYRFAAVYPHPSFLDMYSGLPTHPFLLSASLYYAARCETTSISLFTSAQTQHLELFLLQNLNAYHSGCRSSIEGIMAAFILSFLPGSSTGLSGPDAFRMIGLAYTQVREMGQSVYLDRVLRFVQSGIPLRHLDQQLNDARVFISVINRSAWFAHSRAPWATLPVLMEDAQRQILTLLQERGYDCALDRHLLLEQLCLEVLNVHARSWQALQRNIAPGVNDVTSGNALVELSQQQLDGVLALLDAQHISLPSREYLRCHITYCKWWVTVRNIWSIYRLPSPILVDDVYHAWLEAMRLGAQASSEMLTTCLQSSWKLGSLPSAIGNAVILCFAAISTAILHFRHTRQTRPSYLDITDTLNGIEALASSASLELNALVGQTKEKLDEYQGQLETQKSSASSSTGEDPAVTMERIAPVVDRSSMAPTQFEDLFSGLENWWNWPMGGGGEDGNFANMAM